MEIMKVEQTISGKKNFSNNVFETLFLDEKRFGKDD
jgi:hypothetical protein